MKIDMIGRILAAGYGDEVLVGILVSYLEKVTPQKCYEYIRENIQIYSNVSDGDWGKYRRMSKVVDLSGIDADRIIKELSEERPDLVSIIYNTPNGIAWIESQVNGIKDKLGILPISPA